MVLDEECALRAAGMDNCARELALVRDEHCLASGVPDDAETIIDGRDA